MLGTLSGALEVRGVILPPDAVRADVEGINELRDGIPLLTRVHVHYTLRAPADVRDKVDRALARHREKCPTARSLEGAVQVTFSADVTEDG